MFDEQEIASRRAAMQESADQQQATQDAAEQNRASLEEDVCAIFGEFIDYMLDHGIKPTLLKRRAYDRRWYEPSNQGQAWVFGSGTYWSAGEKTEWHLIDAEGDLWYGSSNDCPPESLEATMVAEDMYFASMLRGLGMQTPSDRDFLPGKEAVLDTLRQDVRSKLTDAIARWHAD